MPLNYGMQGYEMARILRHRTDLSQQMVKDRYHLRTILRDMRADGEAIDPFKQLYSPDELEDYCRERWLPIPEGHREAWDELASYLREHPVRQ